MRFEARELKPYGEPVAPDELRIGDTYFAVLYLDENGHVPTLEPRVFIGRDIESNGEGKYYFQDYKSYRRGIRIDDAAADDEAIFETGAEKHIYDYERALDILMFCSLERRKAGL